MRITNLIRILCTAITLFMSGTIQSWSVEFGGQGVTNGPISFDQAIRICGTAWEPAAGNRPLSQEKMTNFRALYAPLSRGVAQDPEYRYWLFRSFQQIQGCQKIHQFKFSPEFISFLGEMPGTRACQFFSEMWLVTPQGSWNDRSKWFRVVTEFFCQLPQGERNLDSLHALMTLHQIAKEPGDYTSSYTGGQTTAQIRTGLRKIRYALKVAKSTQTPLDMAGLQAVYAAPTHRTDRWKENLDTALTKGGDNASITVTAVLLTPLIIFAPWALY